MVDEFNCNEIKQEISELKKIVKDIASKVSNIEQLEQSEIRHLLLVKDLEFKELINLDVLKELENSEIEKLHKMAPKKFVDVISWKQMVWNNCQDRKMNDAKRIITFTCSITNKACCFEFCPKNRIEK